MGNIFHKDKKKGVTRRDSSPILESIKSLDNEIKRLRKKKESAKRDFDKTFSDIEKDKNAEARLKNEIQKFVDDESRILKKRKALEEEMKKTTKQQDKVSGFKYKMADL